MKHLMRFSEQDIWLGSDRMALFQASCQDLWDLETLLGPALLDTLTIIRRRSVASSQIEVDVRPWEGFGGHVPYMILWCNQEASLHVYFIIALTSVSSLILCYILVRS
jgi:hypothetical protein